MIAYYRSTFLLLLGLLCQYFLIAQDLPVKYLGIDQGLSNNSVISIYQDTKGFMWFGTYDGLNRYDGYDFQVFRNQIGDTTSLQGNTIYTVCGDARQRLAPDREHRPLPAHECAKGLYRSHRRILAAFWTHTRCRLSYLTATRCSMRHPAACC